MQHQPGALAYKMRMADFMAHPAHGERPLHEGVLLSAGAGSITDEILDVPEAVLCISLPGERRSGLWLETEAGLRPGPHHQVGLGRLAGQGVVAGQQERFQ